MAGGTRPPSRGSARSIATTRRPVGLGHTYHLHLQPGESGGGRKPADCTVSWSWPGPLLTDRAGIQVFSLGPLNRIDDHALSFRSPRDALVIR